MFSAFLVLCEENPPVTGAAPSQRAGNAELGVFVVVILNKLLNKQSSSRWFEKPCHSSACIVMGSSTICCYSLPFQRTWFRMCNSHYDNTLWFYFRSFFNNKHSLIFCGQLYKHRPTCYIYIHRHCFGTFLSRMQYAVLHKMINKIGSLCVIWTIYAMQNLASIFHRSNFRSCKPHVYIPEFFLLTPYNYPSNIACCIYILQWLVT